MPSFQPLTMATPSAQDYSWSLPQPWTMPAPGPSSPPVTNSYEMGVVPASHIVVPAGTTNAVQVVEIAKQDPIPGPAEGAYGSPESQMDEPLEEFNWSWLCMPRLPWLAAPKPPPFYGIHAKLPIPIALVMGFQVRFNDCATRVAFLNLNAT